MGICVNSVGMYETAHKEVTFKLSSFLLVNMANMHEKPEDHAKSAMVTNDKCDLSLLHKNNGSKSGFFTMMPSENHCGFLKEPFSEQLSS